MGYRLTLTLRGRNYAASSGSIAPEAEAAACYAEGSVHITPSGRPGRHRCCRCEREAQARQTALPACGKCRQAVGIAPGVPLQTGCLPAGPPGSADRGSACSRTPSGWPKIRLRACSEAVQGPGNRVRHHHGPSLRPLRRRVNRVVPLGKGDPPDWLRHRHRAAAHGCRSPSF